MSTRRALAAGLLGLLLLASVAATAAPVRAAEPVARPYSDDIFYLIMTDRFHNGDRSNDQGIEPNNATGIHGGDLQGVIDKLDYLKNLGVTGIWLTPVVENQQGGYHGYWAIDFYKVDPNLGDMATLKKLVDEAHRRGMKVFLDVVVNHTAPTHPFVTERPDWFHQTGSITNWESQEQVENFKLAGLPDLAQENPEVKRYLIEMSKWWIDQTGVDGFRLDTVRHVPKWFWAEYSRELHAHKPGFFLMGEAWNGDLNYLKGYLETGLDSLVDFARLFPMQEVFARGGDPSVLHATVLRQLKETPDKVWAPFIDNHDLPRFVTGSAPGGAEKLRLALAYLLTSPGMPILYYGTEVAMQGGDDPDNRRDMKFDANPEMFAYTQALIKLRKENPAFTRGTYTPIGKNPRVVAFLREHEGSRFVVAINNAKTEQSLDLTGVAGEGERVRNLLGEAQPAAQGRMLTLAPQTAYVLALGAAAGGGAGGLGPTPWAAVGAGAVLAVVAGILLLRRRRL
ncbi:MAG: alpha-amylase family glycosyl hydrolase [Bacillota bacterium]